MLKAAVLPISSIGGLGTRHHEAANTQRHNRRSSNWSGRQPAGAGSVVKNLPACMMCNLRGKYGMLPQNEHDTIVDTSRKLGKSNRQENLVSCRVVVPRHPQHVELMFHAC